MGYQKSIVTEVLDLHKDGLPVDSIARITELSSVEVEDIIYGEGSSELDEPYDYDDSMDGDHESALASAGWGTDEDYGYYGEED